VSTDDYASFVMADIPGIIEGASDGRGLGLEFLRHIERTKFLLFMLDMANYRPLEEQYRVLKEELAKYSDTLKTRNYAIALTRIDAVNPEDANERIEEFINSLGKKVDKKDNIYKFLDNYPAYIQDIDDFDSTEPFFIAPISSVVHLNVDPLKYALLEVVNVVKEKEED
ncbi:MAG TPA: GTPase ObgE, partial [Sulfurovum sp.]|nr:GTPase ObgE [Sulfurovum sp.]